MSEAAAFYLWPPLWVGERPDHLDVSFGPGEDPPSPRLAQLEEVVRTATLPRALRVRIHRDGMVVFDFVKWAPIPREPPNVSFDDVAAAVLRRVTLMNGYLACLYTAMLECMRYGPDPAALTPRLVMAMNPFESPTSIACGADSGPLNLYGARFDSEYRAWRPKQLDSRLNRVVLLDIATLDDSFARMSVVLERDDAERILGLAELLVRSASAFGDHDYSMCLILAWAVVEALIDELWEQYLDEAGAVVKVGEGDVMGAGRRKSLERWTAASKIEALSLANRLPFKLYRDLGVVRSVRNKWLHELRPVSAEKAQAAMQIAELTLAHVHGLAIVVPKSRSIQG